LDRTPITRRAFVKRTAGLAVAAPAILSAGAPANDTMRLTDGGQALTPIVIAPNASLATKAVAADLADYLGKISGAKFEVQIGDGSRGIVLGTLAEFPNASLNDSLAMRGKYDGKEAFAIHTEKQRLLLIGATDLGASHAAFTLLEQLGCRWFFPAKEWEVVPRQPVLSVSLQMTDRPRILARRIWYGYGVFADKGHPHGASALKDYDNWARRNRMAGSFRVNAGHAWQTIILENKKVFAEHPEYLALVKGKRGGEQLCVSNPEVRRLATAWAFSSIEKNPDREMVSMECSDGGGQCECDNCAKLGSISDRVFGLASDVAREVALKYPGKLVGCLAYNEHSEPPSFALEPNVYVQLTAGFIRGRYTHDQLLELWPQKCRNLGFYEYFSVWLWDFDRLPGGNGGNLTRTRAMIDRYLRAGATSLDAESGNNWGVHGRGYYIANKLLWDPHSDVDELLADFYQKAFGPAASAMQRYYERIAPDSLPLMSRGLIGEAFGDVKEATKLAGQRPDVLARLDQLKHYLRYNHLSWLLSHAKNDATRKRLTVEILTLTYRTRYEYMNHWNAIQTSFAGDAAKKFNEPTWTRNSKEPKPWIVDLPVTPEETAQWFDEGLDYFRPTSVEEVKFDYRDLVAASVPAVKPAPLTCSFQQAERFAVASPNGKPVELELLVGSIAWYRDRPDARWSLKDAQDKIVAEGAQKLDGMAHRLAMNVPGPGVYVFECSDSGAGWRVKGTQSQPLVWLPQRGKRIVSLGQMQELFFYVPKGTQRLHYFYSGTKHKVLRPDHAPAREVEASDEIISIDVPAGTDGQCWSLSPGGHRQLWLMNAPNCFAASPDAMLLPRDLAKHDGIPTPHD
jgi:hypothetical protein